MRRRGSGVRVAPRRTPAPVRNPPQPAPPPTRPAPPPAAPAKASHASRPAPAATTEASHAPRSILRDVGATIAESAAHSFGSVVGERAADAMLGPPTIKHGPEIVDPESAVAAEPGTSSDAWDIKDSEVFQQDGDEQLRMRLEP